MRDAGEVEATARFRRCSNWSARSVDGRAASWIMCGMTKEQLAKRISDLALLRGEFTLRSGRKSNYYLDKYRFETQPDVLRELGQMFAARMGNHVQGIAGAE